MFRYKCRVILQLSTRGNKQTPNYGMHVSAFATEPVNKGPYLCSEGENNICKGYCKKMIPKGRVNLIHCSKGEQTARSPADRANVIS